MIKRFIDVLQKIWNPWPLNPVKIPEGAFEVMTPNNVPYMWVWGGGQVHLVFKNMPWVTVRFDKKVLPELIKALEKINESL
jgi:hypothetical protein